MQAEYTRKDMKTGKMGMPCTIKEQADKKMARNQRAWNLTAILRPPLIPLPQNRSAERANSTLIEVTDTGAPGKVFLMPSSTKPRSNERHIRRFAMRQS